MSILPALIKNNKDEIIDYGRGALSSLLGKGVKNVTAKSIGKNLSSGIADSISEKLKSVGVTPDSLQILSDYANLASESGVDYPTAKQVAYDFLGNKKDEQVRLLDSISRKDLGKSIKRNKVFRAIPLNPQGDGMSYFTDRKYALDLASKNPEDYSGVEEYSIRPKDTVISPSIVKMIEPTGGLSGHIIVRKNLDK